VAFTENRTSGRESLVAQGGLAIDAVWADETCVIQLVGELDLASVPTLERELAPLIAARTGTLIVDLERLRFIDSSGLACLLATARGAEAKGDALRFTGATGQVEQLLKLTGIKAQLRFIG
jgi:anti-sigma B factor antagonist